MVRPLLGSVPVLLSLLAPLAAQMSPPPGRFAPVWAQSGTLANTNPVEGVVWSSFVTAPPGSPWLRVYFRDAFLDRGSYLRIVSLRDGDVMTMRQEHLAQWSLSTAYFNGDTVLVELVAGPNTTGNHVTVDRVLAGDPAPRIIPESICGSTDDRIPSTDARVGRLDPVGCTGWIIDLPTTGNDKCHLSAGHCFQTGQVLQFAVPASSGDCSLQHPPASKQFAIDSASSRSANNGVGDDYWVFRCFPNPSTGRTTFQEQGAAFTLATTMPAIAATLRNTGFGVDGTNTNNASGANNSCSCSTTTAGTRNQVLQTHTGPLTVNGANDLGYFVDTCGGNSGSVMIAEASGLAVAIHTHGGCTTSTSSNNSGTKVTHPGLQAAIAQVCAGTTGNNNECAGAIALVNGANGPFSNASATTSTPAFGCGSGGNDLWFNYTAGCTAPHTFSTCSANTNFDTVVEVLSGSCGTLTRLGCNDDGTGTCGLASKLTVNLTNGVTYKVRVGGFNGATGSFELRAVPGTDNGTITTLATACGPAVVAVVGEPRIGAILGAAVAGVGSGVPFVGIGFGAGQPFCGSCALGHNWASANFGASTALSVPCRADLIGVEVRFQGAGLLTPGGCAAPAVSLSDTKVVVIG
ncbi:MAG: hypothetical protein IPK26_13425 [Planctomycetes bacterium]|nr:hypothetical protein [Planctomycetota bacterium]